MAIRPLDDEEKALIKGYPLGPVTDGILLAHRKKTGKKSYADIAEDLLGVQRRAEERRRENVAEFLDELAKNLHKKRSQ
jgi:hypothetical protein